MRITAPSRRAAHRALAAPFVAVVAAAPAHAAPTLGADGACYLPGQQITLTGGGYMPGASVDVVLALSGARGSNLLGPRDPLTADPGGGLRLTITAPDLASDSDTRERAEITATDVAEVPPGVPAVDPGGAPLARAMFQLTALESGGAPWGRGEGDPRGVVTMRARGFAARRTPVVPHFRAGRRARSISLGALQGACGDITRRMREFPFGPVPAGSWTIRFSPDRVFDPDGYRSGYRDMVVARRKAVGS